MHLERQSLIIIVIIIIIIIIIIVHSLFSELGKVYCKKVI